MKRTFTLAGGKEITLSTDLLDVGVDLDDEAAQVAGWIGRVGTLLATATRDAELADAAYRGWRGAAVGAVLAEDGKVAEWKAKAAVDADPEFLRHKKEIAAIAGEIEWLTHFLAALTTKASMIRGLLNRDERIGQAEGGAFGRGGASPRRPIAGHGAALREGADEVDKDERRERVRDKLTGGSRRNEED